MLKLGLGVSSELEIGASRGEALQNGEYGARDVI
jgi:hypothetical protein